MVAGKRLSGLLLGFASSYLLLKPRLPCPIAAVLGVLGQQSVSVQRQCQWKVGRQAPCLFCQLEVQGKALSLSLSTAVH